MSLLRLPQALLGHRLGYPVETPYPWRWTTPIVLLVFFLLTALLAIANIPLSAYNVVQEFTYWPNDTLAPLPFSNLIPDIH
ncbi:hypothetical protein C8J57DRAFT_1530812 [Mycena rebaudengoi]|nr:hypothetical protein C8J57DRAFT_1530812 [Mycena rebaudengoi]